MNNIREFARVAMGEDGLVSPAVYRKLMIEMLTMPVEFTSDADGLAFIHSQNPWGVAHIVDRRKHKVVQIYEGALHKTALEHTKC